jgi:hypothetical protein
MTGQNSILFKEGPPSDSTQPDARPKEPIFKSSHLNVSVDFVGLDLKSLNAI